MKIDNCRNCNDFSQNDGIGGYYCFHYGRRIYRVRRCPNAEIKVYDPWAEALETLKEIGKENSEL